MYSRRGKDQTDGRDCASVTKLHSKIRPSLRLGTPADQQDSDGDPNRLSRAPATDQSCVRGWQGVVPTQHPQVGTRTRGTRVQTLVYE